MGSLTMIANAPNPAGVGILQDAKAFDGEGISPFGLFFGALPPTVIAIVFFWLLHQARDRPPQLNSCWLQAS